MTHNPHDKLFKAVFSDPENAVAHYEVCLPPELVAVLDLANAQHVPGSWVDDALRAHHSDVAHTIPLKAADDTGANAGDVLLYTIWEHQSTVDQQMALRAHRYTTRLLEDWSREHPGERLPPVVVMVLYHGEAEWTAPLELEDLFALDGMPLAAREALQSYLPKHRYLLEVVPEDPRAVRSGPGIPRMTLVGMKLGRTASLRALIVELMPDLEAEKAKGDVGLHHIGVLVQYLMVVNPEATPDTLAEALEPMGSEVQEIPKTYGQRMIEEGREEGRREEKLETARRALAKGMSPSEVSDLTGLPLEEVQELAH